MNALGSTLLRFDSLSSTNDLAREMAARGVDEGAAVLALEQTAGRGRHGRRWSSPAGEGLYLSLILRPQIKPADSPIITLASAVAVAEALAGEFGIAADIKWPNDVMARGRKICGILVESSIEADRLQYAVLGVGVNLGQRAFPDDIAESATSLFLETGRVVTPDGLLKPLLEKLERWYRVSLARPGEVVSRWEGLSSYARDCKVRVVSSEGTVEGTTRGLSSKGALRVELEDGSLREIVSGEVSLRKG